MVTNEGSTSPVYVYAEPATTVEMLKEMVAKKFKSLQDKAADFRLHVATDVEGKTFSNPLAEGVTVEEALACWTMPAGRDWHLVVKEPTTGMYNATILLTLCCITLDFVPKHSQKTPYAPDVSSCVQRLWSF